MSHADIQGRSSAARKNTKYKGPEVARHRVPVRTAWSRVNEEGMGQSVPWLRTLGLLKGNNSHLFSVAHGASVTV